MTNKKYTGGAGYYRPLGNPDLEGFIVATRQRNCILWALDDLPAIKRAREAFDDGRVEMATGYVENLVVLYAIPRRVKRRRPLYFFSNPPATIGAQWHWRHRYEDPKPPVAALPSEPCLSG